MVISEFAPICLFVYNRLDLTKKTLEALQNNTESKHSHLIIYSDAPKKIDDQNKVHEVRDYIKSIPQSSFKTITIVERTVNLGLANSIIQGVSEVVDRYGNVIVIEDDLVTSKFFLEYMNNCLELYKNDLNVASIHGWTFPLKQRGENTYFLRGADCWGWATWKRAWSHFESNGEVLLTRLKNSHLENKFNLDGAFPYIEMLQDQIAGKNNSWAIRWHASSFLNEMLTLYPKKSFIQNIGFQNELSTHTKSADTSGLYSQEINLNESLKINKIHTLEDNETRSEIIHLLKSNNRIYKRIFRKIKRLFLYSSRNSIL